MSELETIYILNLSGEVSSEMAQLFLSLNIVELSPSQLNPNYKLSFILVKNETGIMEVAERYETTKRSIPIVALDEVRNKKIFFAANGKGVINVFYLKNPLYAQIVKRFLSNISSIEISDVYNGLLNKMNSMKISNHLSIGYYLDILSIDAFEGGFNVIGLRNYVLGIASYLAYLSQKDIAKFPIEVDYGYSKESFLIQMSCPVDRFVADFFVESMNTDQSLEHPFKSLLQTFHVYTDLFDAYVLEKSSKIVLTGLWQKPNNISVTKFYPAFLINNIKTFKQLEYEKELEMSTTEVGLQLTNTNIIQKLEGHNLPGTSIEIVKSIGANLSKHFIKLKRIVEFIQEKNSYLDIPKETSSLTIDEIKVFLKEYPNKELIQLMNRDDYDLVQKALTDAIVKASIDDALERVAVNLSEDEAFKNEYLDQILKNMEQSTDVEIEEILRLRSYNKDLSDDVEVVRGNYDTEDENQMVKGTREDLTLENQLVKGVNLSEENFKFTVKGEALKNDEPWSVKKIGVMPKLEKIISKGQSEGKDIDVIKNEMIEMMIEETGWSKQKAQAIVSGILHTAAVPLAEDMLDKKVLSVQASAENEIRIAKMQEELLTRDKSIEQLKKIIDGLKIEIMSHRKSNLKISEFSSDDNVGLNDNVKAQLVKNEKEIQKRNYMIQKLKDEKTLNNENLEKQINEWRNKHDELLAQKIASSEYEEMIKLRQENKAMQALIESSNQRIATLSANVDTLSKAGTEKNDFEVARLKEQYNKTMIELNQHKLQKSDLLKKMKMMELTYRQIKEKFDKLTTDQSAEATQPVSTLETNDVFKREIQEKTIALKEAQSEIKKLELKIKFMNSQLESAQIAASKGQNSSVGQVNNAKIDVKLKQLETNIEKLTSQGQKVNQDLSDAKKEAHALRTENMTLKNKLAEAERKLAKFDRAA